MRKTDFLTIGLLLAAMMILAGCSDDSETGDVPNADDGHFFHETDLGEDHVLGTHQHVMLNLESANTHDNDSGGEGYDRLHYVWPVTRQHTFCLEDKDGFGHSAKLLDKNDNEVMSIVTHNDCATVTVEAGEYWLEVHHGQKGEDGLDDFIFIRPDAQVPVPDPSVLASSDDASARLRGRVRTDSCQSENPKTCNPVAVGSMESWAADYVGQPQEGQVLLFSADQSQHRTNDTTNQDHITSPSHRAILFEQTNVHNSTSGICYMLSVDGVNFDDSMAGIVVGPSTGVWLYHDDNLGGANDFYYESRLFSPNDPLIPAGSVSSLWVMTIGNNNTYSLISSKSCRQCDLHDVQLPSSTANPLNLAGADLTGANLNGAIVENVILRNALMSSCDLRNSRFTNSILDGVDMSSSHLNGANFTNASLSGAKISNAFLNRDDTNNYAAAIFTDAYMPNVDLSFSDCTRAIFSNVHFFADGGTATAERANLSGASFDNTVLYELVLDQATINGTKFDGAILIGASIQNASQDPNSSYGYATFNQAVLAGADFTNTTLPTVDLSNAQISRVNHSVQIAVKINQTQMENRSYSTGVTKVPTVSGTSTCPDRYAAPCDCSDYESNSGCTVAGRWTPPDPPEIVGDNDPDAW